MTATGTARFVAPPLLPGAAERAPAVGAAAPFTLVATAVVRGRALGLSIAAKLLYVVLRSYADSAGGCFPGYATLQADVGCGINQLTRAVRELEAAGLVTRRRRGQGHPTRYTVHSPTSTPPAPAQTPRCGDSRFTAGVNQESPQRGAEQDSGDLNPAEHHQPAGPAESAPTPCDGGDPPGAGDDDDVVVVADLISRGMTERVARSLVEAHGIEAIREQLAWQAHRPPAKNPAGALVQAIRDAWPPPQAWVEAQERAAAVARQAAEERRRRQEDEARRREWAAKPPEERIAGRLAFWLQGRRFKGHEPTAAEVAARRAELLAELAAAPPAEGVS